jgi:hypothetical protein
VRTWVKATIGAAAMLIACFVALAGTAGYFVLKSLERRSATEADALREMEIVRTRFGSRPPLIEIIDPRTADVRINRLANSDGARVTTIHVVNWKSEDGEIVRTEVPIWLMRFSTLNVLSELGAVPASVRLTDEEIERYGPGIVVDYNQPAKDRVLVWVD